MSPWLKRASDKCGWAPSVSEPESILYTHPDEMVTAVQDCSNLKPAGDHFVWSNSHKVWVATTELYDVDVPDILGRVASFTSEKWVSDPFKLLVKEGRVRYTLSPHKKAYNACLSSAQAWVAEAGKKLNQTSSKGDLGT